LVLHLIFVAGEISGNVNISGVYGCYVHMLALHKINGHIFCRKCTKVKTLSILLLQGDKLHTRHNIRSLLVPVCVNLYKMINAVSIVHYSFLLHTPSIRAWGGGNNE
jgi:hypothetical protein